MCMNSFLLIWLDWFCKALSAAHPGSVIAYIDHSALIVRLSCQPLPSGEHRVGPVWGGASHQHVPAADYPETRKWPIDWSM